MVKQKLSSKTKYEASLATPAPYLSLRCTAQGCNKGFHAPTHQLVRKALMRHLFRYQKAGSKVSEDARDSGLTSKQIIDAAHYLAYKAEALSYKTSEEKQLASRAKYKEANKEKVARASRISNYRAQAKNIPEIMGQGMEAVYKWAEDKEGRREKLIKEEKRKRRPVKEEEREERLVKQEPA